MACEREMDDVIGVWLDANHARGMPPSPERIERVRAKVASPDACVLVARRASVLAMALAEPGRDDNGQGRVLEGSAHISMMFVHPSVWRRGIGGELLVS
jgi:GNAT superfamily N-acetyltransferase